MKSYSDLKKELLEDKDFKDIFKKKNILFKFLNSLIRLRKDKHYSLRELEKLTGIKHSNLSRIENGKQNISYETMWKITQALDGELFITAKGDNVIEITDESMKKLKKLSGNKNPKDYIEDIINHLYENKTKSNYDNSEFDFLLDFKTNGNDFDKMGDFKWEKAKDVTAS